MDFNFLCGFGTPACGAEDIIGWIAVTGFITVALGNILASLYSKPVVGALKGDVELLRQQNKDQQVELNFQKQRSAEQDEKIKHLTELATNSAKVESLRTDTQLEHSAQLDVMRHVAASLAILTRTVGAMAKQMGVQVREADLKEVEDRLTGDQGGE